MQWRVIGAERQTGKDVNRTTDAPDRQSVETWAQAAGILWTEIILDVPYASPADRLAKPLKPHIRAPEPPPQAIDGEKIYLCEGSVTVTNRRVMVGTTTYALANITSVELAMIQESVKGPLIMIVVGIIGLLFIGAEAWICAGIGLILLLIGIVSLIGASKLEYAIKIGSASGEKMELQRQDRKTIQEVVDAINTAIVERP